MKRLISTAVLVVLLLVGCSSAPDGTTNTGGKTPIVIDLTDYQDYSVAIAEVRCGSNVAEHMFNLESENWKVDIAQITPICDEYLFGDGSTVPLPEGVNTNYQSLTGASLQSFLLEGESSSGHTITKRIFPEQVEELYSVTSYQLFFANSAGYLQANLLGIHDPLGDGTAVQGDLHANINFQPGWAATQARLTYEPARSTIVVFTENAKVSDINWKPL